MIPSYNHAHFLSEAIESVLAQTHREFEIIVIDDGSTDDTANVAKRFPVRYVYQKNSGLCSARNSGIQNSNGAYLVFLDADDRLLPKALEFGTNVLETTDCAFVSGHAQNISQDGSPLPTPSAACADSEHYRMFLQACYIRTSGAVMFRTSILKSGIFYNPSLIAVGDLDLYLRIARRFPVRCHHHVVIEYRRHSQGMSRDAGLMLRESLKVLRSQRSYVKSDPALNSAFHVGVATMKRYFGDRLLVQIRQELTRHQWRVVLRDSFVLLFYHPQKVFRVFHRDPGRSKPGTSEILMR